VMGSKSGALRSLMKSGKAFAMSSHRRQKTNAHGPRARARLAIARSFVASSLAG
jgi:hypothetical protein